MTSLVFLGVLQALVVNAGFVGRLANSAPEDCSLIGSLLDECSSATPGIFQMDVTAQAECLCYDTTTWIANAVGNAAATCASYEQTISPALYTELVSFEGFCSSVGDFINTPKSVAAKTTPATTHTSSLNQVVSTTSLTTSPKPTAAATTSIASSATGSSPTSVDVFTNSACAVVISALSFCNSVSPGFTTLDATSQAPCLCYSSTSWSPAGFDDPVSSCSKYWQTAEPSDFSDISGLSGFCTSVGDVLGAGAGASTTGGSGGGGGGIGLTIGGGVSAKSTTPAITPKTTAIATSPSQAPSPITTTAHAGAGNLLQNWALRLLCVACSVAVFL